MRFDVMAPIFVAGMVAGAAIAASVQPQSRIIYDDPYHLYTSLVNVAAQIIEGEMIGDLRAELVSRIAGNAPFIMNVDLRGVCIDVGYSDPRFWQPKGEFRDVSFEIAAGCPAAITFHKGDGKTFISGKTSD